MFRAHSPYSSFFTSGLLSDPMQDNDAVYFDIIFNDDDHYRSFLSLDLAETQSMRSLSLKRKPSSKHTARSSSKQWHKIERIPEHPRTSPMPEPPRTPLPAVPPRLPSLLPLPSLDIDLSTPPKHKSKSFKNPSSSRAPPPRLPTRNPSTVSTHTRLRNRADALAFLEGRQGPAVQPLPPKPRHNLTNFMSMSDDEDEDDSEDILPHSDTEDDVVELFNPSFEPEDIVLPAPSFKTRSLSPTRSPRIKLPSDSEGAFKSGGRKVSQRKILNTSNKANEWFPLKSFIDLCNENDDDSVNWNWRSFIEVSTLS